MIFRMAGLGDIEALCVLRKKQLLDEGMRDVCDMDAELGDFFRRALSDGSLVQWVAEDDGEVVATGGVLFLEFPPSFYIRNGLRAYVTNMYTKDDYRGRGLASALLGKLAEEARARGALRMFLGASKLGKPVYERFGFRETCKFMELDFFEVE